MEVLTTAEMERADQLTIAAGTPGFALMLSAGQAVADAAMDLGEEGTVVVDAGRGHNGGNGCLAAAGLAARGRQAPVSPLAGRGCPRGDAAPPARLGDMGVEREVGGESRQGTCEIMPQLWRNSFPVPRIDGHKYARGHAVVVSGDLAATGAARMAARGALRAGAGLVTVASPRDALAVNAAALMAVMVRPIDTAIEFADLWTDERLNTCVIGPGAGVGGPTRDFVVTALSAKRNLVLDADALTSFADAPDHLFDAIKASHDPQVVLTPHEGEFPRLFSDISNKHPGRSKLERVRAAAERSGTVVLLKGPDTVVASPDGRATIASNAPPCLATAGAGDVLAGMRSGMLAPRVPAFEAASIAVWMHGEAAGEAGPGLIAEDLSEGLPEVFRHLYDDLGADYSDARKVLGHVTAPEAM